MRKDIVFVSFFTPDGDYPDLACKLVSSLDKFKLPWQVDEFPSFGSWQKGTANKSQFVKSMMDRYDRAVVWLDIDTEVWQFPELLFGPQDFAIYNFSKDTDHHLDGQIDTSKMLCAGGVIKFGNTPGAKDLLNRWSDVMKTSTIEDDPELDRLYNDGADVDVLWLPKTYNRMDKHTHHWSSIPDDQVVINHNYTGGRHGKF
jgi:hypothetical protein